MKFIFSVTILSALFCLQAFAQGGKTDTVIIIKQLTPQQIVRRDSIKGANEKLAKEKLAKEKAVQEEKTQPKTTAIPMDSSRFVKRKPKATSFQNGSKTVFSVNRAVFGIYTDYISEYVQNYQKNHGSRLSRIQSSNKAYFKLIDNVMKRNNVPREMKALAIIESAMNCNAVSPVGAVGTWQFMEGTAKMMGLRVDETVDERRDIYKSTHAAAKYLKRLHNMFHDWLLVIASYNCGPAPVLRAINSGHGRSFWDIKPKLPKETQNHVMAFIATNAFLDRYTAVLTMGQSPKASSVPAIKMPKTISKSVAQSAKSNSTKAIKNVIVEDESDEEVAEAEIEEVTKPKFTKEELDEMAVLKVKGNYDIATISKILDVDIVKLRRWNPTFDTDIVNALSSIHLRLPLTKIEQFIIDKDKIIAQSRH